MIVKLYRSVETHELTAIPVIKRLMKDGWTIEMVSIKEEAADIGTKTVVYAKKDIDV